jgi:hypothetical protein
MGIFGWMGLGKEIAEPINAVGNLYTTDKARLEAESKLEDVLEKPVLAQLETNKVLAASAHLFDSGWQPLIGWTCGFLVLMYYAPQIVIITYVWGRLCLETGVVTSFPMKADEILNLVYLLFGIGTYSIAKKKL